MSDVPDDILAAAAAVVERGYDEGLIDAVCRALMAEREAATLVERERCAKISADFSWVLPMFADMRINEATDDAACIVQEQIAAAIRRGTP